MVSMVSFCGDEGIENYTIGTYYAQGKPHPFSSIDGRPLYSTDFPAYPATPHQDGYLEARYWRLYDEKDCQKTVLLNDSRHILRAFDGEQSAVRV